jgi:hypothetical protein
VKKIFLLLSCLSVLACRPAEGFEARDGDLIFQISTSSQSEAIQKATHSQYSHMGIILYRGKSPYVLEAVQTVRFTPLQQWIRRGSGGHYLVKRLRNSEQRLTPEAVERLRSVSQRFLGRPYDLYFDWSDNRIYCSELAWKLYDEALSIRIGKLEKMGQLDLSDPMLQKKLHERFGDHIPTDENVISPAAMLESEELVTVSER